MATQILTAEQYQLIESKVLLTAQQATIGARILPTFNLPSEGITELGWDELVDMDAAIIDMAGETENDDTVATTRKTVKVPVTHKDFTMSWRDLKAASAPAQAAFARPLDTSNAEAATRKVVAAEDDLLFNGNTKHGIDGLTTHSSRQTLNGNAWTTAGNAYDDIAKAVELLVDANMYGPYIGVFNPKAAAYLYKVFASTGIPQLTQVREFLSNIYVTPAVAAHEALILQTGSDIADRATATGMPKMVYDADRKRVNFMVYQISVPRIKQPNGIVHIQSVNA